MNKPIDLEIEAPSADFIQDVTKTLNGIHDEYLKFKKELRSDYNISYSMQVSIFPQWGVPKGDPGTIELVYFPEITWNPFANTRSGRAQSMSLSSKTSSGPRPTPLPNKPGSA